MYSNLKDALMALYDNVNCEYDDYKKYVLDTFTAAEVFNMSKKNSFYVEFIDDFNDFFNNVNPALADGQCEFTVGDITFDLAMFNSLLARYDKTIIKLAYDKYKCDSYYCFDVCSMLYKLSLINSV